MERNHLIAAALSGAAFGILFGYWAYKGGLGFPLSLNMWLTNPNLGGQTDALLFAGLGAVGFVGLAYLFRQNSK